MVEGRFERGGQEDVGVRVLGACNVWRDWIGIVGARALMDWSGGRLGISVGIGI